MIEQPSHCDLLLVAARQGVPPLFARVQSALLFHQMQHMQLFQDRMQIVVGLARCTEFLFTLRVDNLVAESTRGEVRSLRDVCEFSGRRFVYRATCCPVSLFFVILNYGLPYTGHKPPRIRKRLDLPQPLGPWTTRFSPCLTSNDSALTRTSPFGLTIGTLSNLMSSDSTIVPLPAKTARYKSVE